jgi:hypothetical protein
MNPIRVSSRPFVVSISSCPLAVGVRSRPIEPRCVYNWRFLFPLAGTIGSEVTADLEERNRYGLYTAIGLLCGRVV